MVIYWKPIGAPQIKKTQKASDFSFEYWYMGHFSICGGLGFSGCGGPFLLLGSKDGM